MALSIDVYNKNGKKVEEIKLNEKIFAAKINRSVMHESVVSFLHNKRRGSACTKTRAEVRGGGRKPWRQKGTGRARHGSIRSPIWRGGGITFGPRPRVYQKDINKKKKPIAIISALSDKVKNKMLVILDELKFNMPSTKEFTTVLKNIKIDGKTLIVIDKKDFNLESSASNIKDVKVLTVDSLSAYEILRHNYLVMTKGSISYLEKNWLNKSFISGKAEKEVYARSEKKSSSLKKNENKKKMAVHAEPCLQESME